MRRRRSKGAEEEQGGQGSRGAGWQGGFWGRQGLRRRQSHRAARGLARQVRGAGSGARGPDRRGVPAGNSTALNPAHGATTAPKHSTTAAVRPRIVAVSLASVGA